MRPALLLATAALATTATPAAAALPTVDYTLSGPSGNAGWFTGPVTITWSISGATDLDSCTPVETLRDDTTGTQRSCSVHNADGAASATTKTIKIDQTPPTDLTVTPARPPDAPPFYTAPVALTWSATDTTSGIATCTTTTYSGPDTATASPTGTCTDNAGNAAPPLAAPLAFDATPPPLTDLTATPHGTTITLTWSTTPDARTATVTRGSVALAATPAGNLTDGPLSPATTYTYTVILKDAAGNATTATTSATTPPAPPPAAKTKPSTRLPTLHWKRRAGARYYNFQLFLSGHKLLSSWPRSNHYTLHRSWHYRGKTYTLKSGTYRWYVWPGYGPRSHHHYGRLHAKGTIRR